MIFNLEKGFFQQIRFVAGCIVQSVENLINVYLICFVVVSMRCHWRIFGLKKRGSMSYISQGLFDTFLQIRNKRKTLMLYIFNTHSREGKHSTRFGRLYCLNREKFVAGVKTLCVNPSSPTRQNCAAILLRRASVYCVRMKKFRQSYHKRHLGFLSI